MRCLGEIFLASLILLAFLHKYSDACPFCGTAPPSLSEKVQSFDAVVLGRFVTGVKPDRIRESNGSTVFEVIELVKIDERLVEKNTPIELDRFRPGQPGDLVLMLGNRDGEKINWKEFVDMTTTSFQYMINAPGVDVPTGQRLAYFIAFLEHPDQVIAVDAFSEFAIAPYEEIVPLTPLMEPEKIREWLTHPQDPADRVVRLGLYGLLLGLSGRGEDAMLLKKCILEASQDYEFGISGMTSGYLMLAGHAGFEQLRKDLLKIGEQNQAEVFPLIQALEFTWTHAGAQSSKPELQASMRSLLKHPGVADLVIIDLARWKDWDSMEQIVALYGTDPYDVTAIKRAILRYLLVAEKSSALDGKSQVPEHVVRAQKHLDHFRKVDPQTFRAAERYFFE